MCALKTTSNASSGDVALEQPRQNRDGRAGAKRCDGPESRAQHVLEKLVLPAQKRLDAGRRQIFQQQPDDKGHHDENGDELSRDDQEELARCNKIVQL